jgi:hypothetical protein
VYYIFGNASFDVIILMKKERRDLRARKDKGEE